MEVNELIKCYRKLKGPNDNLSYAIPANRAAFLFMASLPRFLSKFSILPARRGHPSPRWISTSSFFASLRALGSSFSCWSRTKREASPRLPPHGSECIASPSFPFQFRFFWVKNRFFLFLLLYGFLIGVSWEMVWL